MSVRVTFAAIRKEGGHPEVPSNSSGLCSSRIFPRDNVPNASGKPLVPDHGVGIGGKCRAVSVCHPD